MVMKKCLLKAALVRNVFAVIGKMCFCVVVAVPLTASAMPTNEEIKDVQPVVNELMAEHENAYRARKKSAKDVGDVAFSLVGEAEGDAAKYLLFKYAVNYYSIAKDFDKAADALETMQSQIKVLPASEVQALASMALNRAGKGEAQRIRAMLRKASARVSAEKEIKFFTAVLRKNRSDNTALSGLANAYVKADDWPRALKVFAKMGVKAAVFELGRDDAGDYNALKAADYWWGFTAKDTEPYKIHAAALYRKATDEGLVKGLLKTRAEKRIAEAEAIGRPAVSSSAAPPAVAALPRMSAAKGLYCVIELSSGPKAYRYPVTYLNSEPKGGWSNEYKTQKLVLRRIEPGTFIMGKDQNDESHRVTFTNPFYIGVFEVTQKQYELVTGDNPSKYLGNMRPVENISWETLRGKAEKHDWPKVKTVAPDTFIGLIRARTRLDGFDLPSQAQWEYACRAGTKTDRYDGSNIPRGKDHWSDSSLRRIWHLGRCVVNQKEHGSEPDWVFKWKHKSDGRGGYDRHTTKVGMYAPNPWGLYDMYGNVRELCLSRRYDSWGTDPVGNNDGDGKRAVCGGSWNTGAVACSSIGHYFTPPSERSGGFRLALQLK